MQMIIEKSFVMNGRKQVLKCSGITLQSKREQRKGTT